MTTNQDQPVEVVLYHVVYAEGYGALLVQFPPDLTENNIIRVTVGQLPDGEVIVNLYTEPNFGYAYNVSCPAFSEWGYLPD
jgi:hypothetical protein